MKPLNTADFHTDEVHYTQLANLAAMARSIFHQVGATEVAQPELTTLVNFNGANGTNPAGGLIADAYGDLFGTTVGGGSGVTPPGEFPSGDGTVFEIAKTAHGYASTPTTLVNFNGANGLGPGGLTADAHGDLFGATGGGGANNLGTVFEIAKTAHGYASTPTTLVSFNGANGFQPGSLIFDAHGDLFGTMSAGGAYFPSGITGGTVFEIAKTAHGYASTPTTLVSFNGANGLGPGGLIADAHGDLFGTTQGGGADNLGTVFEILKTAHGYASTPTTLVSFNGTDGRFPTAGLTADAHGDLFGTTSIGGANDDGTVFEILKTAHGYASTPTTLVSFNDFDGYEPLAGLIIDAHGDLFGTTRKGVDLTGTVFEIAKTAHGYASTPTTLVSFNGANGIAPSGLLADAYGDLFGTTAAGGDSYKPGAGGGDGTVFEITASGFSTHKTPSCTVVEAHDQFVFDPNLGENTNVHSSMHDETIDPKSVFTDFAALTAQAHDNGAYLTAHDVIDPMHDAATLAAQHAHHFWCNYGRRVVYFRHAVTI
jgi:uncharacterized repeat protein (TIGR03803 family)